MSRQRFPSDEARKKQRPHVKIHLSTRHHRKTAGHFDDPEFRGQYLALMMVAVETYANRTKSGEIHISPTNLRWISGRSQLKVATKLVQSLLDLLSYSHELRGEVVVTWIPKFASKQGFTPHSAGSGAEHSAYSASPGRTEERSTEERSKNNTNPPASDSSRTSEIQIPKSDPKTKKYDPEIHALCSGFVEAMISRWPRRKPPSTASKAGWLRDMDRLVRLDHRDPREIAGAITWIFDPNSKSDSAAFWSGNILSPKNLRKQFDRLEAQHQLEEKKNAQPKSNGSVSDAVRRVQEHRRSQTAENTG